MSGNLVQRIKNMILTPKSEWDAVALDTASTGDVYKNYIAPLSAISPIATFIGMTLVGMSVPFMGYIRVPFMSGLTTAIVSYVLGLIGIYIVAVIIDVLAPTFGGEKKRIQALKVAAFSYIPIWVAGVLNLIPALGMLVLLAAIYSLYLLYLGLPKLMKAPEDKAPGYTAAVVICAFVIAFVLASVGGMLSMGRYNMGMRASSDIHPSAEAVLQDLARAGEKVDAAEKSGDKAAAQAAAIEGVLKAAASAAAAEQERQENQTDKKE